MALEEPGRFDVSGSPGTDGGYGTVLIIAAQYQMQDGKGHYLWVHLGISGEAQTQDSEGGNARGVLPLLNKG